RSRCREQEKDYADQGSPRALHSMPPRTEGSRITPEKLRLAVRTGLNWREGYTRGDCCHPSGGLSSFGGTARYVTVSQALWIPIKTSARTAPPMAKNACSWECGIIEAAAPIVMYAAAGNTQCQTQSSATGWYSVCRRARNTTSRVYARPA